MALRVSNKLGLRLLKESVTELLAPVTNIADTQIVRHRRTKHWNPKWKLFRTLKVQKVELPDYQETAQSLGPDGVKKRLADKGIYPQKAYTERPYFIHSTGAIFEAFVPPEGDGKVSPITKQGAMQSMKFLETKTRTMMAIRKIKTYEENFDTPEFCKEATKIYIKMHDMMANNEKDDIIDIVTERAYPEVMHNIKNKTIRWKYIKDIELPRIVQARCSEIITKENLFAQLTVRFHTQQTLAIYDRFGRLMHGSEIVAKDVLEYVVFEKHICNEYGKWRVHAKIIPDWLPPRDPTARTFVKKKEKPEPEPKSKKVDAETTSVAQPNKDVAPSSAVAT